MEPDPAPRRGRHAPPPEVRRDQQRRRLFRAASRVFAEQGYAGASAEAIAREAGMSKATFYEHFDNKEECLLALQDAAGTALLARMQHAIRTEGTPAERAGFVLRTFIGALTDSPEQSQTLLVEAIGAGRRAAERRDRVLTACAEALAQTTAELADAGTIPARAGELEVFAIIGAGVELVSRHLRLGIPADVQDLEPVIGRLVETLLGVRPALPAR